MLTVFHDDFRRCATLPRRQARFFDYATFVTCQHAYEREYYDAVMFALCESRTPQIVNAPYAASSPCLMSWLLFCHHTNVEFTYITALA